MSWDGAASALLDKGFAILSISILEHARESVLPFEDRLLHSTRREIFQMNLRLRNANFACPPEKIPSYFHVLVSVVSPALRIAIPSRTRTNNEHFWKFVSPKIVFCQCDVLFFGRFLLLNYVG